MKRMRPDEYSLFDVLSLVFRVIRRRFILLVAVGLVACLLGYALSFLMPRRYEAHATLLPPASNSGMAGMLAQLGAISGILGSSSAGDLVQLYPDIIKSRLVLGRVLDEEYRGDTFQDHLGLEDLADSTRHEELIRMLQDEVRVKSNIRTGLIEVYFRSPDARLAAALVNEVLATTDTYFREDFKSSAENSVSMIESRLAVISDSLAVAEQVYMDFRDANRVISESPSLLLTSGRLQRAVDVLSATYIELTKQLELARLQAGETAPVLKILDYAVPPSRPTWPPRLKIAVLMALLGTGLAIVYGIWKRDDISG